MKWNVFPISLVQTKKRKHLQTDQVDSTVYNVMPCILELPYPSFYGNLYIQAIKMVRCIFQHAAYSLTSSDVLVDWRPLTINLNTRQIGVKDKEAWHKVFEQVKEQTFVLLLVHATVHNLLLMQTCVMTLILFSFYQTYLTIQVLYQKWKQNMLHKHIMFDMLCFSLNTSIQHITESNSSTKYVAVDCSTFNKSSLVIYFPFHLWLCQQGMYAYKFFSF